MAEVKEYAISTPKAIFKSNIVSELKNETNLSNLKSVIFGNRKYLLIALIGILVQYSIFKLAYPRADYSNDSYAYISAAEYNEDISVRPIGYSSFLRAFSAISTSDLVLTFFQYLILELSCLYLFYVIVYLFSPKTVSKNLIFIFLMFNPVSLNMGNYVGSDGLFLGISIIWIAQLLLLVKDSRGWNFLLHIPIMLVALSLRYNALFYPLITAIAYVLAKDNVLRKVVGVTLTFFSVILFIKYTAVKTKEVTGVYTFSAFSGWQIANNALHIYIYSPVDTTDIPSNEYRNLAGRAKRYFDEISPRFSGVTPTVTTEFIWNDHAVLQRYWHSYIKERGITDSTKAWHAVGPFFAKYGYYLIEKHPVEFTKYYLLPNIKEYYFPWLEVFEQYNMGQDSIKDVAQEWFKYKTPRVSSYSKTLMGNILKPVRVLYFVINILFVISFSFLFISRYRGRMNSDCLNLMIIFAAFVLVNFAFSVFASPIIFRYQVMTMMVCYVFCVVIVDKVFLINKTNPTNS